MNPSCGQFAAPLSTSRKPPWIPARTQDITTHISDKEGQFRFSGLDLNADYEIHAEHEGWTSASRSISNFDNRKEFVLTLKLDRKKAEK